jgi:4-hydroxybenzoate polyprenyltransferase
MVRTFKKIIFYSFGFTPIFLAFSINGQEIRWWQYLLIISGGFILSLSGLMFDNDE